MEIKTEFWGTAKDGKKIYKYYVTNGSGAQVVLTSLGASIVSVLVPDKDGKPTKALHTYTIINAIRDKNVLRFHVDYSSTMRMKNDVDRKKVWGIDTDEAMHDPRRIRIIVKYIIEHFSEKTFHKFNSILAVDSVKSAILYYNEFKRQLAKTDGPQLKVATIYTFNANEEEVDEWGMGGDENPEEVGTAPDVQSRDALEKAIKDYNKMWEPNT